MSMRLLLVTFSLRNPNKDYTAFFVALRGNAINWWHFIEQTTVVSTHRTPQEFATLLIPNIEANDSLLVAEIDVATCQGWLPQQAWDWFRGVSEISRRGKLLNRLLQPPSTP